MFLLRAVYLVLLWCPSGDLILWIHLVLFNTLSLAHKILSWSRSRESSQISSTDTTPVLLSSWLYMIFQHPPGRGLGIS